jgi:hypothetical protein
MKEDTYTPNFKIYYLMAATLLMSEMSCENKNRLSQKESNEVISLLESIPPTLEIIEIDLDSNSHIELSSTTIKHSSAFNNAFYLGMIESRMSYSLYQKNILLLQKFEKEAEIICENLSLYTKEITKADIPTSLIHQNLLEYYESISHQLYKKEKFEIQLLIASGSWLETQNYLAEQYLINKDPELLENIIEQEITLNVILEIYNKLNQFKELEPYKNEFTQIKKHYESYNANLKNHTDTQNSTNPSIDNQRIVDKKTTNELMNSIIKARKNITL